MSSEYTCPICGGELEYEDYYGRILAHQDGEVIGDIWRCPNGVKQDGSCESEGFRVAGAYHSTRRTGELCEGYPC